MLKPSRGLGAMICVLLPAFVLAQAPAPSPQTPAAPAAAGQGVARTGDPDPGVHFIAVVDNPQVLVLQITVQPGGARRPHMHNDVTFNVLVPVTGSLELTVDGQVTTAVPGQAYYILKGQEHSFANRAATPVQVMEIFTKTSGASQGP